MRRILRTCVCGVSMIVAWTSVTILAQTLMKAPETFSANAQASGQNAGATAVVTMHIEKYTDERDLTAMTEALRLGGYPGFLPALRKAPEVGYVEVNGRKTPIRWARQLAAEKGRTISIVTDAPLFFLGGGAVEQKPRAGYELAVIQLNVDSIGLGTGSMAAAARVKPGGPSGVQIDDYADQPIKLVTVRKSYQ